MAVYSKKYDLIVVGVPFNDTTYGIRFIHAATGAPDIDFGVEGGDSSMSRTVSLPAAIGAHMILTGKITETGVLRPVLPGIYNPVLDELATMDIACEERTETY